MDSTLFQDDGSAERLPLRAPLITADAVLTGLRILSILTALAVSAPMLTLLGLHYDESQGSPLGKIHPATYLLLGTLTFIALREGPFRFLAAAASQHLGTLALLWSVGALLVYNALFVKLPLSSLVDTFLCPAMALLVFKDIRPKEGRWLSNLIHAIFLVNALLALFEMTSGWRLTPLVIDGEPLLNETRSSALMGHPLSNAMMTGSYIIVLACGGDAALRGPARLALIVLQAIAMVPMGGRAASLTALAIVALLLLREIALILAGKRFSLASAIALVTIVPAAVALIMIAYDRGFFDILITRFVSDSGSTQARVVMFDLFSHFSWYELLFGPNQDLLKSLMWTEGTEYGIESFPVALCLAYGIVPAGLLLLGIACFAWDIVRSTRKGPALPLVFFFAVAATSLSLGTKTIALAELVIISMVLFNRNVRPRSNEPGVAHPS